MPVADLREWMRAADAAGELLRIDGADRDADIGGITDLAMERIGRPAILFDDIPGFAPGFRVLSNAVTSPYRIALTLDLDPSLDKMGMVRACRGFVDTMPKIPPRVVSDGPVLEHVQRGSDVDLLKFPAPRWHEEDGGYFIGTGSVVIQRDPDTGWVNLGCYRLMVQDEQRLGIMISAGKQGRIIMEKYWARGEPGPMAVSFGHDPLLLLMAGSQAPTGVCEYDIAGGIRGAPVDVIPGEVTGLPIPATAEIVVEGFVDPHERLEEGPFGEWTGYYAGGRKPEPVLRVERLLYRDDPVILGVIPRKPPSDDTYMSTYQTSAAVWNQLEAAGIQGVKGVWAHEAGGSRMFLAIGLEQLYPGHAKQAGMVAAHCYAGGYLNKFVVVVDNDIDPTSLDDVLWAMCTRVDARSDLDVIERTWSSPLDPMAYPPDLQRFTTKLVVDACRPWERRQTFPAVAASTPAERARVIERWGSLLPFLESERQSAARPTVGV